MRTVASPVVVWGAGAAVQLVVSRLEFVAVALFSGPNGIGPEILDLERRFASELKTFWFVVFAVSAALDFQ